MDFLTLFSMTTILFNLFLSNRAEIMSPMACTFDPKNLGCSCKCHNGRDGRDGRDGKDGKDLTCASDVLKKGIKELEAKIRKLEDRFKELNKIADERDSQESTRRKAKQIDEQQFEKYFAAKKNNGDGNNPDITSNYPTVPEILSSIKNNVPQLDREGKIPQQFLPGGYDKFSASDLAWQTIHTSAAAACRGLNKETGRPGIHSVVLVRNTQDRKTCRQICSTSWAYKCEGEVSIWGMPGKGIRNAQEVANFYNFGCDYASGGGSEAQVEKEAVLKGLREAHQYFFSYCCCSYFMGRKK